MRKAEGDYENARLLARQRKRLLPDNLCWASEQSAEKYLKAFLVRYRVDFERRHDLVTLNELCAHVDPDFRLLEDAVSDLEPCSPAVRYPGTSVTAAEARSAFEAMKVMRKFVRAKLGLM
ncbi:MAG: HEPN domain-containing protein [Chloroflexota bacterium]|nr:HEPN domain-containing protein [Chloroflexota bacterium]